LPRRIEPRLVDRGLCVVFAALAVVDIATGAAAGPPAAIALGLGVFICLPLLRRRAPIAALATWSAVVIALVAAGAKPYDMTTAFVGLFVYPFSAGAYAEGRRVLVAIPAVWGALTVMALDADRLIAGDIFFPSTFGMLFLLAGRAVRSRSRLTAELHEAAVRADEEREAEAERAVADERRRIAREMHDVVAHSVSMMVVQAGGARRILDRDPARAIAAADLIERTGREALVEMRALLGVLHAEEHPEYAPQPTLRELEALVERVRGAGVAVEMTVEGERRELPAGLDLAAYRVVQEALTNVVKHAGGAPAEVSVHYLADAVEVRIADRGEAKPVTSRQARQVSAASRLGGGGHGLVGMRERVRVYGGELHAGRRRGGGFEVHVRLPFETAGDAALTAGARP
jgi:signal transduction histidine kinase